MVTCPLLVIFTARISLGEVLLAVCTVVHRPTSVNCDAGRPGDIDYEHVDLRALRLGQAINQYLPKRSRGLRSVQPQRVCRLFRKTTSGTDGS